MLRKIEDGLKNKEQNKKTMFKIINVYMYNKNEKKLKRNERERETPYLVYPCLV